MNTLVLLAGMGSGIVILVIVVGLVVALDRRVKKEQRDANKLTNDFMAEGNRLRERRAVAMEHIAKEIELYVETHP